MTNEKIERLGRALKDDLILRLASSSNPTPVAEAHDADGDLYLTVSISASDYGIIKFEPQAAQPSGLYDSLGLAQAVYTPHVTKLGFCGGSPGVAASATATLNAVVATNSITIDGHAFTAVASGATGDQFNVGGTDTITATNLAAAINASVTAGIANVVSATSAGAVVTIYADSVGAMGNTITLTATATRFTLSSATLLGGVNATDSTPTSEFLKAILIAECAPTGTALVVYETVDIAIADLDTDTLVVATVRNIPWGLLAQM